MWTYKGDVNSALGGNSKEPLSSSTIPAEASFDDDINKKVINVNKRLSVITEKKWDINNIQPLPAQVQQKVKTKNVGEGLHY